MLRSLNDFLPWQVTGGGLVLSSGGVRANTTTTEAGSVRPNTYELNSKLGYA